MKKGKEVLKELYNARKIKLHHLWCRSCFATSDFSEHKKIVPNNFLCRKSHKRIFMHPKISRIKDS